MSDTSDNKRFVRKKRIRISLVVEVAFFFLLGLVITGILSYLILKNATNESIKNQKMRQFEQAAYGAINDMAEYYSYDWILGYWIEHAYDMDVEYDSKTITDQKTVEFAARHPGLVIKTALPEQIEALSEEDQRIFAEIVYNEVLLRFNHIKSGQEVEYIYLLATDDTYTNDMFLVSGSDVGKPRGSNYGDSYILGTRVTSTPSQVDAMKQAAEFKTHIAETEQYMDIYVYVGNISGMNLFVGVTYDLNSYQTEIKDETMHGVTNFVLLQLVLSVICLLLLFFFTIRPLKMVQSNVRHYRDYKDSDEVIDRMESIRSLNEIGDLKDDICEMVESIDEYMTEIRNITAEKERIGAELNVATKIQADMLPSDFPAFPDRKDFDIYATMDPAKEVGGDFYDFFLVDDNHLAMVIADVSGKGVPAALFMVISKTLIKTRTLVGGSPAEILYDVNNQLCERNDSGYFVTVWLGILDLTTGKGVAANAGHEHPALCKKGGSFEMVKYRHSPALGTMQGIKFREHDFEIEPGDRIFVYTDGVPEATSAENELFGEERALAALNRLLDPNLPDLLVHVKEEIDGFVGEAQQFDDITMLGFDYYGPNGKNE